MAAAAFDPQECWVCFNLFDLNVYSGMGSGKNKIKIK
jgi:hypothetical protein